jgi:glutamyl-tRNA reductase
MSEYLLTTVLCVGLSHKTASVAQREHATLSTAQQAHMLEQVANGGLPDLAELVILSTCNRTELYAVSRGEVAAGWQALRELLAAHSQLSSATLAEITYALTGTQTIQHIFRVAAGLESQLIGEPHILGQLVRAYELAQRSGTAHGNLSALMQRAIRIGKQVRHRTLLTAGTPSVSVVAVRHAARTLGSLCDATALILGAGEMAHTAAAALVRQGIGRLIIANRTLESAARLAALYSAEPISLAEIGDALAIADLVIAAAATPKALITAHTLSALNKRPSSLICYDLGLPRNIDPSLSGLEGVHLYDLDALHRLAESQHTQRVKAISQAEVLVCEAVCAFERWLRERRAVPALLSLYEQADQQRKAELRRLFGKLPTLSAAERALIETFSRRLSSKLLHTPTLHLKAQAAQE